MGGFLCARSAAARLLFEEGAAALASGCWTPPRSSLAGEEVEEHAVEFGADLEAVSEISFVVEEDHDGQEILCW